MMQLLLRYFSRQYLVTLIAIGAMLLSLVYFLEIAELFRRASDKANVTGGLILWMGITKLPETGQKLLPFIILFGAIATLWRLTRRQELVIARTAGLSVWQFTRPLLLVAFVIGVLNTFVLSPMSATLLSSYKRLETKYLQNTNTLELSGSGLWLRQPHESGTMVIHAPTVAAEPSLTAKNVLVLFFGPDETYHGRWDAESAELLPGQWRFYNVHMLLPGEAETIQPVVNLPTKLTIRKIEDSLAQPESLSFWELPSYIRALEATGFSPTRHRQHYFELLAQPLYLVAMVLVAIVFMQRQTRSGNTLATLIAAIGTGVFLFVLNNTVLALGTTESLPAALAAWVVPVAACAFAISALLHLEDA